MNGLYREAIYVGPFPFFPPLPLFLPLRFLVLQTTCLALKPWTCGTGQTYFIRRIGSVHAPRRHYHSGGFLNKIPASLGGGRLSSFTPPSSRFSVHLLTRGGSKPESVRTVTCIFIRGLYHPSRRRYGTDRRTSSNATPLGRPPSAHKVAAFVK